MTGKELYDALMKGKALYSQKDNEEGVDMVIPLRCKRDEEAGPQIYLFCGQNKLVESVKNLGKVEKKALEVGEKLNIKLAAECERREEKTTFAVAGLFFTTHKAELRTELRSGVWFTQESLPKWLSRLGPPRLAFPKGNQPRLGTLPGPNGSCLVSRPVWPWVSAETSRELRARPPPPAFMVQSRGPCTHAFAPTLNPVSGPSHGALSGQRRSFPISALPQRGWTPWVARLMRHGRCFV